MPTLKPLSTPCTARSYTILHVRGICTYPVCGALPVYIREAHSRWLSHTTLCTQLRPARPLSSTSTGIAPGQIRFRSLQSPTSPWGICKGGLQLPQCLPAPGQVVLLPRLPRLQLLLLPLVRGVAAFQ